MKNQLLFLTDLNNMKDESYFRQQLLMSIEKLSVATERLAKALEDSLKEESKNGTIS
jgi:hypothetical protein